MKIKTRNALRQRSNLRNIVWSIETFKFRQLTATERFFLRNREREAQCSSKLSESSTWLWKVKALESDAWQHHLDIWTSILSISLFHLALYYESFKKYSRDSKRLICAVRACVVNGKGFEIKSPGGAASCFFISCCALEKKSVTCARGRQAGRQQQAERNLDLNRSFSSALLTRIEASNSEGEPRRYIKVRDSTLELSQLSARLGTWLTSSIPPTQIWIFPLNGQSEHFIISHLSHLHQNSFHLWLQFVCVCAFTFDWDFIVKK